MATQLRRHASSNRLFGHLMFVQDPVREARVAPGLRIAFRTTKPRFAGRSAIRRMRYGAIGLTIAPRFARLAHGPTMSLKEKEFVQAARAIGVKDGRLLTVHIIPNIAGELLVLASLWTASSIRLEASLSFIGLGVQPPTPSWGQMIRDGTLHLTEVPMYSLAPGIALLLTVLAFNLLGDGIRDVLDPRAQT